MTEAEKKKAYGERYSEVVLDADRQLQTDERKDGDLSLVQPMPRKQKKVRFAKGK